MDFSDKVFGELRTLQAKGAMRDVTVSMVPYGMTKCGLQEDQLPTNFLAVYEGFDGLEQVTNLVEIAKYANCKMLMPDGFVITYLRPVQTQLGRLTARIYLSIWRRDEKVEHLDVDFVEPNKLIKVTKKLALKSKYFFYELRNNVLEKKGMDVLDFIRKKRKYSEMPPSAKLLDKLGGYAEKLFFARELDCREEDEFEEVEVLANHLGFHIVD